MLFSPARFTWMRSASLVCGLVVHPRMRLFSASLDRNTATSCPASVATEAREETSVPRVLSQEATEARLHGNAAWCMPGTPRQSRERCAAGANITGSEMLRRKQEAGERSSATSMKVFLKRYATGSISPGDAMLEEATAKPCSAPSPPPEETKSECRCGWCTDMLTIALCASPCGMRATLVTRRGSTVNTSSLCRPHTKSPARTWKPSFV
mmetsp:Transcript_107991/g.311258  ORF Transcript_107991/g.311258 Transcript_107991/m.311258 type:complete len:210 (-) Transcript_107991:1683-2312(-)